MTDLFTYRIYEGPENQNTRRYEFSSLEGFLVYKDKLLKEIAHIEELCREHFQKKTAQEDNGRRAKKQ